MHYRLLVFIIGLLTLPACSSGGGGTQLATMTTVAEVPTTLLAIPTSGTLRAYVAIDGGVRTELSIVSSIATRSIPSLSRASHNVLLEFEFTDSGSNTVTVATASKTVDLSAGDASLTFINADYDLANYDDDNDGLSNATEIAAGTNPMDSGCVLGTSLIGRCTL